MSAYTLPPWPDDPPTPPSVCREHEQHTGRCLACDAMAEWLAAEAAWRTEFAAASAARTPPPDVRERIAAAVLAELRAEPTP